MTTPSYISHDEVAHTFIRQYDAFIEHRMEGTVFTDDQMAAMVGGIKTHPEEMCLFFINVASTISRMVLEETNDYQKAHEVILHYNSVINSLMVRVIHILYNHGNGVNLTPPSPPRTKKPPKYTMEHDELFGGLDFKMPDWNELNE